MDGVMLVGARLNYPPANAKTSGRSTYHTKAHSSEVDETLFGTPQRLSQQIETRRTGDGADWEPPWSTGPTMKGAPLLWTPFDSRGLKGMMSPRDGTPKMAPPRPSTPRSKNRYKKKSGGSYVDESLFGPNVVEPSFEPPWTPNEAKDKPLLWSPQATKIEPPNSEDEQNQRPSSRLGVYADPYIPLTPRTPRDGASNKCTPVIQSRPGSNIKTRNVKSASANRSKINAGKLSRDELIERALKIAQDSKNLEIVSSRPGTPASTPRHSPRTPKAAWVGGRPLSASSSRGYRNAKTALPRDRRKSGDEDIAQDFLKATGIKVPFTARSSSRPSTPRAKNRPSSARPQSASWRP